jgi:hypothetical protein
MAQHITLDNLTNPQGLEKILNAIVDQIDEITTLANEIKADYNAHTHDVSGTTSSGLSVSVTSADVGTTHVVQGV